MKKKIKREHKTHDERLKEKERKKESEWTHNWAAQSGTTRKVVYHWQYSSQVTIELDNQCPCERVYPFRCATTTTTINLTRIQLVGVFRTNNTRSQSRQKSLPSVQFWFNLCRHDQQESSADNHKRQNKRRRTTFCTRTFSREYGAWIVYVCVYEIINQTFKLKQPAKQREVNRFLKYYWFE